MKRTEKMFCRKCQRYIKYADYVAIDNLFNIHHFACGSAAFPSEPFMDTGAYAIIYRRYLA